MKTLSNIGNIDKHCTNCGMMNHNMETCKKKKEQTTMATIEAIQPSQNHSRHFHMRATYVVCIDIK
jgi:hypothetical protein